MLPSPKGRGSAIRPANPYLSVHVEPDLEQVEGDADYLAALGRPATECLPDLSHTILQALETQPS
jgi:hypothetical protein